jgi:hypothetical protein
MSIDDTIINAKRIEVLSDYAYTYVCNGQKFIGKCKSAKIPLRNPLLVTLRNIVW